jgi:hypothetical protein
MSRIPSYPFRVVVYRELAGGNQQTEQHNHSTLPGAYEKRDVELSKKTTRKVELLFVLDETTPAHRSNKPLTSPIRSFRVDDQS